MNRKKFNSKQTQNGNKNKRFRSDKPDPFFDGDSKRRKKSDDEDSIQSSDSDEFNDRFAVAAADGGDEAESEENETVAEKHKRLAKELVENYKEAVKRKHEDGDELDERGGKDLDSLVAQRLQAQQLEDSGRVRRFIASR